MLVDTHVHLDVPRFDEDRAEVLARAREAGVGAFVVPGIAFEDLPRVLALAEAEPDVYCAVGIHPHEAHTWQDAWLPELSRMAQHPKVVAIGELGQDFYYPEPPRAQQHEAMVAQVRLAGELGKPIIVHDREAHGAILEVLKQHLSQEAGGVMHCFSGSYEYALECIKLGMAISFAGSLTFKNAPNLHEAATRLPVEHLLVETDGPYLAPIPHRGKRNEPAFVRHTAEKLAELKGLPLAEVAEATTARARALFRIP